jgi:hypothetical protein
VIGKAIKDDFEVTSVAGVFIKGDGRLFEVERFIQILELIKAG